ncbi:Ff.00g105730.m01.CDS01 [Fusarium sp. VM40]|nr:Ff.00g105730.m01.CDS01 [Fusarium sp. VM40]
MYSNQAGINARYEPQATDDDSWDNRSDKFPSNNGKKKAFYRPTALRWYFILGQIAFLMAVMGLTIWALIEMPNSDGTAKIIHKRNRNDNPNFPRDDSVMTPEMRKQTRLATTVIVSDVSTVVTVPGTTGKYTTHIPTTEYSTHWGLTTTVKDGSTITSVDYTVIPTKVITEVVTTKPGEATKSAITSISVGYSTVYPSGTASGEPSTVSYTQAVTITMGYSLPGVISTYTSTLDADRTETVYTTIVEDGETKTISHLITEAAPTVYESVGETTASASTYVSYGKITITSIYTDPNPAQEPMAKPKPTHKAKPTVIDVVTVDPDHTVKKVEKLDPTTYVTKVNEVETVAVVVTDAVETVVSEVEAAETTLDVVETGADGLLTTKQVVSTNAASLATITRSAAPTTIISTKSTDKLKTVTSERTDSSTFISTVKGTTRTYEKTTTILPTATDDASEAEATGAVVKAVITVYELHAANYFLGKFVPPMLAVMLSIPARVIDYNAQLFQPFYAMNQVNGAMGPESMNLHFSGWAGIMEPFNILLEGHPVPFITMLIVWFSALLAPIASEAVGFKMHGQCKINAYEGCAPALGVSPLSSRILLAILGLTIILLCALLFFLRKFNTGLYANPWSVAGIASLASNRDIRPQKDSERKIEKEMAEKRYGFGFFENRAGKTEYGIVLYDDAGENLQHENFLSDPNSVDTEIVVTGRRNPFAVLGLAWRLVFLLFLLGLMVFLLYYHLTIDKSSSFKNFMNSQTFGVRFLFAAFGVIISFCWTAFFITIAMVVPYQVMSHSPQSASNSVLLTRPTNPFSGFWSAIKHRQVFPGLVALMAIFSEFMPILLANIPYSLSQVRISHDICARLSVGILALMAFTILLSFVIRWPDMPVDPRSIAGAMYYVSESNMVDHFSGMAAMDGDDRKKRIKELGGTYLYGELTTREGERRPAVEWDDHTLSVGHVVSQQRKDNVHVRHENVDTGYYGHQP